MSEVHDTPVTNNHVMVVQIVLLSKSTYCLADWDLQYAVEASGSVSMWQSWDKWLTKPVNYYLVNTMYLINIWYYYNPANQKNNENHFFSDRGKGTFESHWFQGKYLCLRYHHWGVANMLPNNLE